MRAKFINEAFTDKSDPIHDMGIGIYSPRDFKDKAEITRWMIKHLPIILKVDKIPEDIVKDNDNYINRKYLDTIRNFCNKYFTVKGKKEWPSDVFPFWEDLRAYYIKKGYSEPE